MQCIIRNVQCAHLILPFFLFRFNFVAQFSKIRKKNTTTHLPYLPVRFGKAVNSMSMHSLSMLTILAYYSD